jgi:S1-C subfamily serine protease
MPKTKFVLLLVALALFSPTTFAQSEQPVTITIKVVDKSLNVRNVPKHVLVIGSPIGTISEQKVSTSFDGTATVSLPAGDFTVRSESPLDFDGRTFRWTKNFTVKLGGLTNIELSNDNAEISSTSGPASAGKRRVSEAGDLFKTLRNGVVTVEGELGNGTGFIFDEKGLVLTNYHVISETTEVRVRFDKYRSVRARVLAKDVERDIAVLHVNLAAFPVAEVLKIASSHPLEPTAVVGEHVFTIGSPANQEKVLTAGIVSKIEDKAIISDISFNAGNAGGPFFNSLGEVVGVTTFKVSDKDGSGLAGVIRIEEAAGMIEEARAAAAIKLLPSAELMPNIPEGTFPVDTIKNAIQAKTFAPKQYLTDVKRYDIKFMTPVYKFYAIEKDRIDSLKSREKRNKGNSAVNAEMFRDLSIWNEYAGELAPVVDILALPEVAPTGRSLALSAITAATIGYSTPFDNKFRADFYSMKLLCDGKEVTPIRRTKTEIQRDMQSYYKTRNRYTYAGVYSYPSEIFAPDRCSQLVLHVFSEEDIETPIVAPVTQAIKNRIWSDFSDYRKLAKAKL